MFSLAWVAYTKLIVYLLEISGSRITMVSMDDTFGQITHYLLFFSWLLENKIWIRYPISYILFKASGNSTSSSLQDDFDRWYVCIINITYITDMGLSNCLSGKYYLFFSIVVADQLQDDTFKRFCCLMDISYLWKKVSSRDSRDKHINNIHTNKMLFIINILLLFIPWSRWY